MQKQSRRIGQRKERGDIVLLPNQNVALGKQIFRPQPLRLQIQDDVIDFVLAAKPEPIASMIEEIIVERKGGFRISGLIPAIH